jgi:hypothetical protein
MSDNPLAQIIGGLTKPVSDLGIALIDKIGDATGILYEPLHIRRIAKAKAKVSEIEAKAEIEITDLHRRVAQRWIAEQVQQQESMENTITKSIPQLNEDADPNAIEDDWIIKFFDKCRLVTDDKVQDLWASILAGEANRAGSYSPKTLTTLADMNQKAVMLFNSFCSLCIVSPDDPNEFIHSPSNFKFTDVIMPVIKRSASNIEELNPIYQRYGIGSNELQLLFEHGLIQDSLTKTYTTFGYDNKIWGFRDQVPHTKKFTKVRLSGYTLSTVGTELFHISKRDNPQGYFKLLKDFLQSHYKVKIIKCGPR